MYNKKGEMHMLKKIIDGIIFCIFGLVVLLMGILSVHSLPIIVLGGLLILVGILCIIRDLKSKS